MHKSLFLLLELFAEYLCTFLDRPAFSALEVQLYLLKILKVAD